MEENLISQMIYGLENGEDWFPHVYGGQFGGGEMSDVSKIGSISFIKSNGIVLYLYSFGVSNYV